MDPSFQPDDKFIISSLQSELARAQQRILYLGACLQQMQTEAQQQIAALRAAQTEEPPNE